MVGISFLMKVPSKAEGIGIGVVSEEMVRIGEELGQSQFGKVMCDAAPIQALFRTLQHDEILVPRDIEKIPK